MARKLYWGSGSTPCWRVMLVLEEKGIEYESKLISFSKKEHKIPEILAVNPRGQVPTFVDGEIVVNESGAAMQYLEDTYPESGAKLLPSDPKLRALVLQRVWETNNLIAKMGDIAQHYFVNKDNPEELEGEAWVKKVDGLKAELAYWEKYLEDSASGFLVGDGITLADCAMFPTLAFGGRFGLDYSNAFPSLAKYKELMEGRESTQKTSPPHWKEGPGPECLKGI